MTAAAFHRNNMATMKGQATIKKASGTLFDVDEGTLLLMGGSKFFNTWGFLATINKQGDKPQRIAARLSRRLLQT